MNAVGVRPGTDQLLSYGRCGRDQRLAFRVVDILLDDGRFQAFQKGQKIGIYPGRERVYVDQSTWAGG